MADRKSGPDAQFSSPPCFLHELAEGQDGACALDPQQSLDVGRWRMARRQEFLTHRAALSVAERQALSDQIGRNLIAFLDTHNFDVPTRILSAYWPIKSEPDLRSAFEILHRNGLRLALPVVVQKSAPLAFHEWAPGDPMERGFWNIAVPAHKRSVTPDILLAPLVGWDRNGYRLGYGGGYFDRTLASLTSPRFVIGIGLHACEVKTIFPQPHDIPLDAIVTEQGLEWVRV